MRKKTETHKQLEAYVQTIAGHALPWFEREHTSAYLEDIAEHHPQIKEEMQSVEYRESAKRIVEQRLSEYRWFYAGSKMMDSFDRVLTVAELAGEAIAIGLAPIIGFVPAFELGAALESVDLGIKSIYMYLYHKKTKDFSGIMKFMLQEALSYAPGVGSLLNLQNTYVNRLRDVVRETITQDLHDTMNPYNKPEYTWEPKEKETKLLTDKT